MRAPWSRIPRLLGGSVGAALLGLAGSASCLAAESSSPTSMAMGAVSHPIPHVGWSSPFALLLLAIALLPLVPHAHHWWERNSFKLATGVSLGMVTLGYYGLRGFGYHGLAPGTSTAVGVLKHAILHDYVPFMVLLTSLFLISGGIQIKGNLRALPSVNTAFLGAGAILASLIGTTGASMVLIRPLLQTNREREHVRHTVVFFIFVVSNIGGCLLPLGDPPLFLGYLNGVPFSWTLTLALPWLFCVTSLLAVYFVWDRGAYRRESSQSLADDARHYSPPRLHGAINLVWLLGVVLAVSLIVPGRPLPGTSLEAGEFVREAALLVLAGLSLLTTPRGLRRETEFSYAAILEVACLFLGIFLTMQVPIEILQARAEALGIRTPCHFFWATGLLSSFLDNAPTYVVFFETARSLPLPGGPARLALTDGSIPIDLLAAISLGAVFMGANSYIGNAPNLMVKLIAEQRGVKMPSFFGYMLYSGAILLPLFLVVSLLFLG